MTRSKRSRAAWQPRLWLAAGLVAIAGCAMSSTPSSAQQQNAAVPLAKAQDLKTEAFRALRAGEFDKTSDLISQAEAIAGDPTLEKIRAWLGDYQTRLTANLADRQKQYDAAVATVRKLQDAKLDTYACDAAANAYLHVIDKRSFPNEPWVKEILAQATQLADEAEHKGDWLAARRLYLDLSAIEPINARWRAKVNDVSRRLGLLAMYAPDSLSAIYDAEAPVRQRVAQIVSPEKGAATKPVEDQALNDEFKIDWRQMLSGVKVDMLAEALEDARESYYRDTTYAELVAGGVNGLDQLVTTAGLDKSFPKIGDPAIKQAFVDRLNVIESSIDAPESMKDKRLVTDVLGKVLAANRETLQLPDEVVVYEFSNGATSVLDPFTNVIWPYDLIEFQKSTQGEFTGVGVQIMENEDGYLKVVSPLPDSPAYKAGIHADDIVTQINGKNAKGVKTMQAVKAITGPRGTTVMLTIQSPDGTTKEHILRRDVIRVASVKGWTQKAGGNWDWMVDAEHGIAYLRLTNFTKDSADEIRKAIDQVRAENGKALILDLRSNPGGLLNAATDIADRFLSRGNIVSTRTAKNVPTSPPANAHDSSDDVDLPTVVLVNQYSASASEIVSGALKDQKRALIVGERTFGKGSVQMLFPLENREAYLKLTTSHYYLPSGRCLHREEDSTDWGVDPDVAIDMTPEQMRSVNKMRQELDVLRDQPATNPTTLPAEFKSREEQLLASDPQLGAAVLLLRVQLTGATLM